MLSTTRTVAFWGLEVLPVHVEVDSGEGLPRTHVVGKADKTVRESERRILSAFKNSGIAPPAGSVTISLAPSDIPKSGAHFDLPIAVAMALASGRVPRRDPHRLLFLGELALTGLLRPVPGVLNASRWAAEQEDLDAIVVPRSNVPEASLGDAPVIGVRSLEELFALLWTGREPDRATIDPAPAAPDPAPALEQVRGQETAKRALEVAAAGNHNLLLTGPPGSGKTLLARCLSGLLPTLSPKEQLEVTCIHAAAGLLKPGHGLIASPPFRAPHHSASQAALLGGGTTPRPGEVTLAHRGVLFLDELPEFRRDSLECLRQPLEERCAVISRARYAVRFPARFLFLSAMNPCPCGYLGDGRDRCRCSPAQVERYRQRVSGPLLDRIDLQIEVEGVSGDLLVHGGPSSSVTSGQAAARVAAAQDLQCARSGTLNGDLTLVQTERYCTPSQEGGRLLRHAVDALGLTARGFHRALRVARTLADLDQSKIIHRRHLAEAVQYRLHSLGPESPGS